MEAIAQERFNMVVSYFEDLNIDLPVEVKNAIEDVFRENDNVENVECYHLEDKEQFETDLSPTNIVMMNMDGSNSGEVHNYFTYYGGVEHDLLEQIHLYDGDELHTEISNIEGTGKSFLENDSEYTIILIEVTKWNTSEKELTVENTLMIYCPEPGEGYTEEDLKFKGIYNEIKAGENYGN